MKWADYWREFWHVVGHPTKEHHPVVVDWDSLTGTGTVKCGPCDKRLGTLRL